MIKNAMIFIVGGAVGFGLASILMRKEYMASIDEIDKEYHQKYEAMYDECVANGSLKNPNYSDLPDAKNALRNGPVKAVYTHGYGEGESDKPVPNNESMDKIDSLYEKHANPYHFTPIVEYSQEIEEDDNGVDEEPYHEESIPRTEKEPYVIPEEDFVDTMTSYEKRTLFYYSDGTLTDEEENMIEDSEAEIGYDALHLLEGEDVEIGVVYSRADHRSTDYEIIKVNGTFKDITSMDE